MNVRKIFFPVAAGLFISPALWAADLDGPTSSRTFSDELLSTADAADVVYGDVLAVTLGAEYDVTDGIFLDFSGSALNPATLNPAPSTPPDSVGGSSAGITLSLISSSADQAVYEVTDIPQGTGANAGLTTGVTVVFAGADVLEFNAQAVDAANGVSVDYSAQTVFLGNVVPRDTGGGDDNSTDYIETDSQFSAEMVPGNLFDETIDVNQDRKGFVSMSCCDNAFVELDDAGGFYDKATFVDQDVVWEGDFSWIIDTDENTAGIQPLAGVVTTSCGPPAITSTSISYTCPFTGSTLLELVPVNNDDPELQTLPDGPFSVSVVANFTGFGVGPTEGASTFAGIDAGQWDLNGFKALIPYMPYGTGISQVIYLVNRGQQFGDVTVDYTDQNGMQGSLGVVATLGETTTLSLGNIIRNALPAALRANGRLGLTITANVPAKDVQINSQYNVSGNRAFTLHEDNRPD